MKRKVAAEQAGNLRGAKNPVDPVSASVHHGLSIETETTCAANKSQPVLKGTRTLGNIDGGAVPTVGNGGRITWKLAQYANFSMRKTRHTRESVQGKTKNQIQEATYGKSGNENHS